MALDVTWSRRHFLKHAGISSAGMMAKPIFPAVARPEDNEQSRHFAYVASKERGIFEGLHVFSVRGNRWIHVQHHRTLQPSAVVTSADQRFLYVANDVSSMGGLPSGSVEAYAVDPRHGTLNLLGRRALALSAIHPQHLAISPDGRNLAVSVAGGAAYNVLPIREDGTLGSVTVLRKEIGSGGCKSLQRTARPQGIVFDAAGRLIAADFGMDCMSVYEMRNGGLQLADRVYFDSGSGPAHLVTDKQQRHLFVGNALRGGIKEFYLRGDNLLLTENLHRQIINPSSSCSAASLCGDEMLLVAEAAPNGSRLHLWRLATGMEQPRPLGSVSWPNAAVTAVSSPADSKMFAVLDESQGRITTLNWVQKEERLSELKTVAKLPNPTAIAWVRG